MKTCSKNTTFSSVFSMHALLAGELLLSLPIMDPFCLGSLGGSTTVLPIVLAVSQHRPGSVPAVSRHRLGSVSASFWQCPTALAASRHRSGSVPPPSWQCPGIVLAASPHRSGSVTPSYSYHNRITFHSLSTRQPD